MTTVADADESLALVEAIAARDTDPRDLALIAERVHAALVGPGVAEPDDERGRALGGFIDRFVIDVAGIDDELRGRALGVLGAEALAVVQALSVIDLGTRRRLVLERLGLPADADGPVAAPEPTADLWSALEAHWRLVARLEGVDPLTTELVRLRGAAAHGCRLCRSRRNVAAVAEVEASTAAVDPLEAVLEPRAIGLDPHHRDVIALVDAMTSRPTDLDADVVRRLRAAWSPDQLGEIVHDVVRNGANKIAVAFGADAPQVSSGVELFRLDDLGEVVVVVDPA